MRIPRWLVIVTAAALAFLAGGAVAVAVSTANSARAQTGIQVKNSTDDQATSSGSFVDLNGASVTFTVPAGAHRLVVSTFSAESFCNTSNSGGWCSVRVVLDGTREMNPASGSDFAFDSDLNPGANDWIGASMQRSVMVGAGTHTVKVQFAVVNSPPTTTFALDDWQLTTTESAA